MADCSNVDIRELLPERASGALSAADLARVDAHLASCLLCAEELALIHSARLVLRRSPRVDVARIAGAVRVATSAPARPVLVASGAGDTRRAARSRWIGWKAAAAIALAAAGGGTMLLWNSADDSSATRSTAVAANGPDSASLQPPISSSTPAQTASTTTTAVATVRPALNVAGGLADLTDGDLQSLLDDMGSLGVDSPSFDEPEPVIPQLPGSEGTES